MRRRHKRFTGAHPVLVALDGVDLAVVGDKAIRMRQRPGGKGVGGKAAMQKHERALQTLVLKVGIEIGELRCDEHPLVDECARRKAGEIHAVVHRRTRSHSPFRIGTGIGIGRAFGRLLNSQRPNSQRLVADLVLATLADYVCRSVQFNAAQLPPRRVFARYEKLRKSRHGSQRALPQH